MLFGNDNAWQDRLLDECYISHSRSKEIKPILVGRWGIGKSATLMKLSNPLTKLLKDYYEKDDKIWYLGETAIHKSMLAEIRAKTNNNIQFEAALEKLWYGEIIRRECILLDKLRFYYNNSKGNHWDDISRIANIDSSIKPLWNSIPDLLTAVFKLLESSESATKRIQYNITNFLDKRTLEIIHMCHIDIDESEIKPFIVIEPLDTPASALEREGLAQYIM